MSAASLAERERGVAVMSGRAAERARGVGCTFLVRGWSKKRQVFGSTPKPQYFMIAFLFDE